MKPKTAFSEPSSELKDIYYQMLKDCSPVCNGTMYIASRSPLGSVYLIF